MPSFLKLTRPLNLLLAALTYVLGASIPAYLGKPFQSLAFLLGLAGILFAQLSMSLLAEVFRPHNEPLIENETPKQKEMFRNNALYISIAALSSRTRFIFRLPRFHPAHSLFIFFTSIKFLPCLLSSFIFHPSSLSLPTPFLPSACSTADLAN